MKQDFSKYIKFEDDKENIMTQDVKYDQKPISSDHCKGVGHAIVDCKQKHRMQVQKKQIPINNVVQIDAKGFQLAKKLNKAMYPGMQQFQFLTDNTFAILGNEMREIEEMEVTEGGHVSGQHDEEGGEPPAVDGQHDYLECKGVKQQEEEASRSKEFLGFSQYQVVQSP